MRCVSLRGHQKRLGRRVVGKRYIVEDISRKYIGGDIAIKIA